MSHLADFKDLYSIVLAELKALGVKVPKTKKLKSNIIKQEKISTSGNKIFGANLSDQEFVSESGSVLPKFLAEATAYLRAYSEVAIGLFRKVGSIARQRDLRDKLEKGDSLEGSEPNDVASLLKQWLRELPEPLIPSYLYDLLIRCINLDTHEKRTSGILLSCMLLRPENLYALKHLLQFLADIASNSDKNMMDLHNLALIMAPNLLAAGNSHMDNLKCKLVETHTSLVELLIEICPKFGEIPPALASQLDEEIYQVDSLDSSIEGFLSPSKSKKKRRSASVQDIFSAIRKLVGQPWTPVPDSRSISIIQPATVTRSASKRKADRDLCLVSPAKKPALSKPNEITENYLDATPIVKGGKKHSRVKSFNLLRKKERKSHRTPNSKHMNKKTSPPLSMHSSFIVKAEAKDHAQTNFLDVVETPASKNSPLLSLPEIEHLSVSTPIIKKSTSDCLINSSQEMKNIKRISSSTSQGNLPIKPKKLSPYSLRSKDSIEISIKHKEHNDIPPISTDPSALNGEASVKRNESVRRSSRKKHGMNVSEHVPKIKLNDVQMLYSEGSLNSSCKGLNDHFDEVDAVFIQPKESLNVMPITKTVSDNDISKRNVLVPRSPKRSSSRKLKTKKPNEASSLITISASQKKNPQDSKVNSSSAVVVRSRNSITKPSEEINDLCSKTNNVSLNGTLPKLNGSMRKEKCKTESLRQDPLLNRKNSSRRRKREVTHVKSLDSTSNQFKRSSTTYRSLKVGTHAAIDSEKPAVESDDQHLLDVTEDKGTPQNSCLLRRETKSSLRRGRPNTIKSGLPSELCPRYNNPISKSDSSCIEATRVLGEDVSLWENTCADKSTNSKIDESIFPVKTLLDDICDTLNISVLDGNMEDPPKVLSSEDNKNNNIGTTSIQITTRSKSNQLKRVSSLNLFALNEIQINSKLNEKCNMKPKNLSNSDSKLLKGRKNNIELKRRKTCENFTSKAEPEIKEKKKKWSTSSFDDLKINQVARTNSSPSLSQNSVKSSEILDNTNKSPTHWVSGDNFFDLSTLEINDKASKRESIAQILKNNSGNVLAKVHQYNYVTKSTPFKTPGSSYESRRASSYKTFKTPNSVNMSSSRRSSSQRCFKTPNSVSMSLTKKDSTSKSTRGRLPIAPPPKFIIDDSSPTPMSQPIKDLINSSLMNENTEISDQAVPGLVCDAPTKGQNNIPVGLSTVSHPLKELTNISLLKENAKVSAPSSPVSITPTNNENTHGKLKRDNSLGSKLSPTRIKPKRNSSYSGHTPYKLELQFSRSESSPMLDKRLVLK